MARICHGPGNDMKSPKSQGPGFWVADKTSRDTKDNQIFCPKSGMIKKVE
jgi:hypothetical protein